MIGSFSGKKDSRRSGGRPLEENLPFGHCRISYKIIITIPLVGKNRED